MTYANETPALGAPGLGKLSCVTADGPRNSRPAPANQASDIAQAKRELTRDWLHECLGFARIYAENCQSFLELGDYALALLSLAQFEKAARAASECGAQLRALREVARP